MTYYAPGGEAPQQYATSSVEVPQVTYLQQPTTFLQQPAVGYMSMPGAEENPVAGAQTFAMPQAFQGAPAQPSGMQTVQSMVMPMPNFPANQPATDNAPNITPTPAPAQQAAEPDKAAASAKVSSSKASKKSASKKGKTSKKKKSGCC